MAGAFQAHHLQPRTTAETQPKSNHDHHDGQNPTKIKSQQKSKSPQNHKSNHTHRNQSTKLTKQQKSQMKILKVNLPLKKYILILLLYFRRKIILLN